MNYAVIRDGSCTLLAQGGGAGYSLDYNFAVGSDRVLQWLDNLSADEDDYLADEWFDDIMSEGGAVIDVDRKVLLLFSSAFDYGHRAAMLDGYSRTWAGWEIRWAYDGVADLAAYVGSDVAQVRESFEPAQGTSYEGDCVRYLKAVVSIRDADRCRVYGLGPNDEWRAWWRGPQLLEWLADAPTLSVCAQIPQAGLHLDLPHRRAGLWSIAPLRGLASQWHQLWPGWTLDFWQDDYRRQIQAADGVLAFPDFDLNACLKELADRLEHWPVREILKARGVDNVDWLVEKNFAGFRSQINVVPTAADLRRIADTIGGE